MAIPLSTIDMEAPAGSPLSFGEISMTNRLMRGSSHTTPLSVRLSGDVTMLHALRPDKL